MQHFIRFFLLGAYNTFFAQKAERKSPKSFPVRKSPKSLPERKLTKTLPEQKSEIFFHFAGIGVSFSCAEELAFGAGNSLAENVDQKKVLFWEGMGLN